MESDTASRLGWNYVVVSFAAYMTSFLLPVLDWNLFGFHAFFLSLLWGLGIPMIGLSWFANVALWVGIYHLNLENWRVANWCGAIGTGLALIMAPIWPTRDALQVGYYVWLSSMIILMIGAMHGSFWERREIAKRKRMAQQRRMNRLETTNS